MRKENDSMGNIQVPDDAYYGAQTQRAIENFPISGIPISKSMIKALGIIKRSAAVVNHQLGKLGEERKNAIIIICNSYMKNTIVIFFRSAPKFAKQLFEKISKRFENKI